MKTKRSGYSQKGNQSTKKNQTATGRVVTNVDVDNDKKQENDCNGCCAITWKPGSVAR